MQKRIPLYKWMAELNFAIFKYAGAAVLQFTVLQKFVILKEIKKREINMNNWERMKAGRLYNADSKDLEKYHSFGMETCDKFNRTPLWMHKRKQRLLEN